MKQLTSQNLIIEMSVRELEMVENALLHYSQFWEKRADDTLSVAEVTKQLFKDVAKNYEELWRNVTALRESLPF